MDATPMRHPGAALLFVIGASLARITEDVTQERRPKPIGNRLLLLELTAALEKRKSEMSGKLDGKDH
jgi:hypothetical protein